MAARAEPLHEGGHRGEQDAVAGVGQLRERLQAFGNDLGQRREDVVGQGLPVGKMQHRDAAIEEEPDLVL